MHLICYPDIGQAYISGICHCHPEKDSLSCHKSRTVCRSVCNFLRHTEAFSLNLDFLYRIPVIRIRILLGSFHHRIADRFSRIPGLYNIVISNFSTFIHSNRFRDRKASCLVIPVCPGNVVNASCRPFHPVFHCDIGQLYIARVLHSNLIGDRIACSIPSALRGSDACDFFPYCIVRTFFTNIQIASLICPCGAI